MTHTHHKQVNYCPYCGHKTEQKEVYGETHAVCSNCGWTHYEDPKVAAAVLICKNGSILLTRRIFSPHKGAWTLPAGFMNAFEDPVDAAKRECLEETGLEVEITSLFDVIGGREHPRGADMVIVYRAIITGGTLKPGDDADQATFFSLDNLPTLAFKATESVVEKLRNNKKSLCS